MKRYIELREENSVSRYNLDYYALECINGSDSFRLYVLTKNSMILLRIISSDSFTIHIKK
jgi:hypothetical protein